MKPHSYCTITAISILIQFNVLAQTNDQISAADSDPVATSAKSSKQKHLNFFVVSKRKKGSLDLASRFNVLRSKLKSMFRKKKFVAIIARDGNQMSEKVKYRLNKYNAKIGTIWFDSHGMYKKGYSLFFIGKDEYSYKTLKDSSTIATLLPLSPYTDHETKLIIGSCYGGATYHRASIDYKDTSRMNGDSLMIAIGRIFIQSSVYASESWVMTKPGLFLKREAVAGYPGRKLFRDICYKPAWENAGKWNSYSAASDTFTPINPVTLDMYGNAIIRSNSYSEKEDVKKDIGKNLEKLEAGLYK